MHIQPGLEQLIKYIARTYLPSIVEYTVTCRGTTDAQLFQLRRNTIFLLSGMF